MARDSNFPREGLLQFSLVFEKAVADSGLRQLNFAKQVGISQGSVSHWTSNLKANEGDRLSSPSASNILVLAQFIHNPQTGQPFTPSELFAICSGENRLTSEQLEDVKFLGEPLEEDLVEDSISNTDIKQVYWNQIIVPGVSKMLDSLGEKQENGSLFFASKEYTYTRDTSGDLTITPKDGRPPLSPRNMNQRDINVMTAIFDKMQKTNQSVKAQEIKPSAGKVKR